MADLNSAFDSEKSLDSDFDAEGGGSKGYPNPDAKSNPQSPPAPPRGFALRAADKVSDALPTTGALLGGAIATPPAAAAAVPTFGASSLLIPGAGAAGYGVGNFLKTLLDKATGRNVQAPTFTESVQGAGGGALDAMNAFSAGGVGGKIAQGYKYSAPVASSLKGGPTPFSPLSGDALSELLSKYQNGPRDMALTPPISSSAQTGSRYATPRVAGATRVGAETLGNMAKTAGEDVDLFNNGARAERAIPAVEGNMRANVTPLAQASGQAIKSVRSAIGPYPKTVPATPPSGLLNASGNPVPGSGPSTVMSPPGENVVNRAFNFPSGQNKVISNPAAMESIADVKHLGLQNKSFGRALGQDLTDVANAARSGLTQGTVGGRQIDADTLGGLSKTLTTQRGGLAQGGPERGWGKVYTDIKKAIAGPQSGMGGLRGETPETSALQETPRLLEIETARRGLPGVNPQARVDAYQGLERPAMSALSSPGGQALTGADFEIIRKLLAGER